ncbi:SRPBCC domain-containing protein [Microbacterium sp. ProA8]
MAEEPASSITVDHHFDADQRAVWEAWTDPEVVRRWWGSDPDGVVTSAALDVRPGGRFAVSFKTPAVICTPAPASTSASRN